MPPWSMPSWSRRVAHSSSSPRLATPKLTWSRPDAELAELLLGGRGVVLVEPDERAAHQEHGVVHVGVGVLVDDGFGTEQGPIPEGTSIQIADRESNVGNRGKLDHLRSSAGQTFGRLAEPPILTTLHSMHPSRVR
jgi:hypothetical protein